MGNYIFLLTFNLHPFPDMGKGWRTDSKKTLAIAFCHISILVLKVLRPLTLSRIANLSGKSECVARGFSPIINPRSAKVTRRDIHFFFNRTATD